MKKTYQSPTTEIVKIQTVQMIAESLRFGRGVNDASGAESRRGRSSWDDDEE